MKKQMYGGRVDLPEEPCSQFRELINHVAHSILEQIQERACERNPATFDECFRAYDPPRLVSENLFDISTEDQIQLIECCGNLPELNLSEPLSASLRADIEKAACRIVVYLAETRARELFEELEAFMTRYELEVSNMIPTNPLADRPHQTEWTLGDRCIVLGFRAPDGSVAEILEFRLAGVSFFFQRIRR